MRHTTLTRLVALTITLSSACAAAVGDGVPTDPAIVPIDAKADTVVRVDVGRLDVFSFTCDLDTCVFEVAVSGRLDDGNPDGLVATLIGSYDDIAELRRTLPPEYGAGYPETVDFFIHHRAAVEGGGSTARFEVGRGEHYGLLTGVDERVRGRLDLRLRVAPDFDGAMLLPKIAEGAYRVQRGIAGDLATDAWFVPVEDIFNLSPSPLVTITRHGSTTDRAYYVCDSDGTSVPVEIRYQSAVEGSGQIIPSCPTWDESGRLYVEVTHRFEYELDVVVTD